MNNIIFVISSGRSGSKSIVKSINGIHNIKAFHGPNKKIEKENCFKYQNKLKHPVKVIKNTRLNLVNSVINDGFIYLESSWFLCALSKEIVDVFPECKIIHLVRDGRDFVRSGMNRPWFNNNKNYQRRIGSWSRDHWNPPSNCKTRFEKICWLWNEQQKLLINDMASIPSDNNGGIIKLEHLIKNGINLEDFGLDVKKTIKFVKVNSSRRHKIKHYSEWDDSMIKMSDRWMGKMLKFLGYKK